MKGFLKLLALIQPYIISGALLLAAFSTVDKVDKTILLALAWLCLWTDTKEK